MLSGDTYTGWTRYIDPTARWIGATCFRCRPVWEYAWRFSSHLWSLRVLLVLFVLSWTSSSSLADIKIMSAPVSRRASTPMMTFDDDGEVKLSCYSSQFKIICIALFSIQSLQSSFTGNYISAIDLYIVET